VGDQQHHLVNLAVDIRPPVCRAIEARAVLGDDALEVADDLFGL